MEEAVVVEAVEEVLEEIAAGEGRLGGEEGEGQGPGGRVEEGGCGGRGLGGVVCGHCGCEVGDGFSEGGFVGEVGGSRRSRLASQALEAE